MRLRMYAEGLHIDLITKQDDLLKVVRLAAAAGLMDMRINMSGEDNTAAVQIHSADGAWAADVTAAMLAFTAAMLAFTAAISGQAPEELLTSWRERHSEFEAAKEIRDAATA